MDNLRPDEIFEDENSFVNSFDDTIPEQKRDNEKITRKTKYPVLTFQLVVVLCITLFLFIVKFCSADLFSVIMDRYEKEISKSVIYDGDDTRDISGFFSTDDEV